jgi:hypothetical protein
MRDATIIAERSMRDFTIDKRRAGASAHGPADCSGVSWLQLSDAARPRSQPTHPRSPHPEPSRTRWPCHATGPDRFARSGTAHRTLEGGKRLCIKPHIFNLSRQNGKGTHVPHIPVLKERNVRTGFFERDQIERVADHLPAAVRPIVRFAYITGWRIPSEVLPLQWRHIDFEARMVRIHPHTTKNDEGRTFPFTDALQQLLEAQKAEHDRLKAEGVLCHWVFHRTGKKVNGKPIVRFTKAWRKVCAKAGCPSRIPHNL